MPFKNKKSRLQLHSGGNFSQYTPSILVKAERMCKRLQFIAYHGNNLILTDTC